MSKHQALRAIKNEIKRLNHEIDLRIIKGLSYKEQSRRHKYLMAQLNQLGRSQSSWFGRLNLASAFSSFMF
jgi:hypothetical protein